MNILKLPKYKNLTLLNFADGGYDHISKELSDE